MNWGIPMTDKKSMDDLLDDMFAEARTDDTAQPSDDFMARMLAEATALQPPAVDLAPEPAPRRGLLQLIYDTVGGWQGASGLMAATMASVWIGFSGAETLTVEGLQAVISGDTEYYLSDLGGDFSFDFEEG